MEDDFDYYQECSALDIACHLTSFFNWIEVFIWGVLTDVGTFILNLNDSAMDSNPPQLPSDVIYYLQVFHVGTGLTIIFAAYVVRFIIRRIPFIG